MKAESQNIEFKENWRDEFIKWICGFANADGGKLYIGINDDGIVTGLLNAKKLMEDIPNKAKDILGILVDVNLKTRLKKSYLEIVVESCPYPINYKGQYYFRSGSTNQELKGAGLNRFMLRKQGVHWDSVPQPHLAIKDLAKPAFDYFKRKATDSKRITPEDLKDKPDLLLQKLQLKTEIGYLKRAAALLFHPDPERYFTGAYVKIGYFNSDSDLAFMDEAHGYLFQQVEKIMDLLLTKYLKAMISYKGIQRIEKYPIPETALREAIMNAIIHKDYSSGNPIQISVYVNKIIIWNAGQLPDKWTINKLKTKHPSEPFNPDIANCFFRAGQIEAWGRGTINIINACKLAKVALPIFKYESGVWVEFRFEYHSPVYEMDAVTGMAIDEQILALINKNNKITIAELVEQIDASKSTIERNILKLRSEMKLKRVGSDKGGYWEIL